jgi:hypothetical protein
MFLGADPMPQLTTRGLYGHSAASAAETLQFQQQPMGMHTGVQLVNDAAFSQLTPQQLQQQIQQQTDIIRDLQAQNPYLPAANPSTANAANAAPAPPQQLQQQYQPQQPQQPQQQFHQNNLISV